MKNLLLQVIKIGSSLPVALKGKLTEKLLRRVLYAYRKRNGKDVIVHSNLGISNSLKVGFPVLKAPSYFLFGTPALYTGEYHTLHLASLLTRYCSAFVDIGANWGFYSYFVAVNNKNKPLYWFEPNKFLYKSISRNFQENNLQPAQGSDLALSDTNGTLTFYLDQSSDLISSIVAPQNGANTVAETVATTRFDNWASNAGIPANLMVKVDVENAEWQFIKGAQNALDKIDYLVMEVLGPARKTGFINYMIKDLQFQAYYINQENIEHVQEEDMRYTPEEFNWLFCRQSPEMLREKLLGSVFKVI